LGLSCPVFEAVYKGVPRLAVGFENARVVLTLPAASAFDVGAVAVSGGRSAHPAVLTKGKTLSVAMYSAHVAETGSPTDALLADVGALIQFELALRHGSITLVEETLIRLRL
jgi:hypothetical protein